MRNEMPCVDDCEDDAEPIHQGFISSLFTGVGDQGEIDQLAAIAGIIDTPVDSGDERLGFLDVQGYLHGTETPGRFRLNPDDGMYEDYTDTEWMLVLELRSQCIDATRTNISKAKRSRAIEWLFVPSPSEDRMKRFEAICSALGARAWVVQSLVQHLWYLRDMAVGALPFMAVPLPEPLEHEAIIKGWEAGGRVAGLVWANPGASTTDIIHTVCDAGDAGMDRAEVHSAMRALLDTGLIGQVGSRVYFTSRPTYVRKSGKLGWSRSFVD